MRQLIVNVPDAQMLALEKAAKSKDIRPEDLIAEQLTHLVTSASGKRTTGLKRHAKYHPAAKVDVYTGQYPAPYRIELKQSRLSSRLASGHNKTFRMIKNGAHFMLVSHQESQQERSQPDDERSRRRDILKQTAGIWKDRDDQPKDGLEYQMQARAEWD